MSKLPRGGNLHGSNASATPIVEPNHGPAPRVGQTGKPYTAGSNAHGKRQSPTQNVGGAASKQGASFYARPAKGPAK